MEELGLAMLRGQLKYVSICILHTDFERMAYQLSALPLCILIRRVTSFRGEPTLHWRSARSIEIAMQPVLLQHNCGRTAFPFESCRSSRLPASNWVLGRSEAAEFFSLRNLPTTCNMHLIGVDLTGMYLIGVYGPASHGHASHRHASYGHTSYGHASYRHTSYRHTSYGHASHGRASHRRASHEPASYKPVSYGLRLMGTHLIGMRLMGMHLMGVVSQACTL